MKKKWACSFCHKKYCRLGKWLFRHFQKFHTDALPKCYELTLADYSKLIEQKWKDDSDQKEKQAEEGKEELLEARRTA